MVDYRQLVGRRWQYGVSDCYTLIRDFYALTGVSFPDFARPDDLARSHSIFLHHAADLGFKQIQMSDGVFGDVLVMRLGTRAPNHAAIYVGDMQILHQRQDMLSGVDTLCPYYVGRIAAVFRHAPDSSAA